MSGLGLTPRSKENEEKLLLRKSLAISAVSTKRASRKDLSNYPPCQILKLDDPGTQIITVGNEITGETVLATTSSNSIVIYSLNLREDKEKSPAQSEEEEEKEKLTYEDLFEIRKIHQLDMDNQDVGCFAISSVCSVTLPPLKLLYAVAPVMSKTVYYYHQLSRETIPPVLKLDDHLTCPAAEEGEEVQAIWQVTNNYPVTKLAIDGEKEYLACVLSNSTVVVWDLPTAKLFVKLPLRSHGIHVEWHKSEPYKLMVVEAGGWIRFYNVFKETCFMSINTGRTPLYSADWAFSNSLYTTVGWSGGFTIINCSQLNSNQYKIFEIPQVNVSRVKFNPDDDKVVATLGRTPGVIRLWRQNFMSHIWSHKNKVDDIAWVHGHSYLLALGSRRLYIYEASVL